MIKNLISFLSGVYVAKEFNLTRLSLKSKAIEFK